MILQEIYPGNGIPNFAWVL